MNKGKLKITKATLSLNDSEILKDEKHIIHFFSMLFGWDILHPERRSMSLEPEKKRSPPAIALQPFCL